MATSEWDNGFFFFSKGALKKTIPKKRISRSNIGRSGRLLPQSL